MGLDAPAGTGEEIAAARLTELPEDIAPAEPLIEIPPCDAAFAYELESALGLHPLAAQTLTRRGIGSLDAAREWIEGGDVNDPESLPGAPAAADAIAAHVKVGSQIAVHGDYDVDGVCSTAILVRTLAALGADVTWHVPSRFGDGYGLTRASIERLAENGAGLIVAVDCGIGSVDEVAYARELGVDVVICDHHTIGEQLPAAPVVHPGLGGYSDPYLCAAAATHKLAALVCARADGDHATLDEDLALVALATVCDVVPLRGENRALVRQGLAAMRATQRPGLRELMRVAGVDQLKIGASSFGFALGPRINAVGRMHSAEPAVELLLTSSEQRASELAGQLGAANHRRREVEQEILFDAEAQARAQRDRHAIVVAGEGWHPGVLGIVAGRLAERFSRPAIALTIENGVASGSGRSGGVYDLHGGLRKCSALLTRFGGHRAAAGLELDLANLDAFVSAITTDAENQLTLDDLRPRLRVDAVGRPADVNLDAVAAIEQIGPFGAENPQPQVLFAGAELIAVAKLGKSGQHFKLGVSGDGSRTSVVAFRQERVLAQVDQPRPVDLVVELQRNEFNGREEAQAVLRGLVEHAVDRDALWREEFESALADPPFSAAGGLDESRTLDRRERTLAASLLEFAGPGSRLAIAVNDPLHLRAAAAGALGAAEIVAYDDPRLREGFTHVLMAEPPPSPVFAAIGDAVAVMAWDRRAVQALAGEGADPLLTRARMVAAYRALQAPGSPDEQIARLRAAVPNARIAGRAVRALEEIEVVRVERSGQSVDRVVATESGKKDLELSFTFRSYSEYVEESREWLRKLSAEMTSR